MNKQKPRIMTYEEFADGYAKHVENVRLLVRHKAQGGGKWRKDAEDYVAQVESVFMDLDNNFRRWLSLQPCVFDHPITHNHTEIVIGDDCEAIFHFLVYCRKIHKGEPIDEDFSDYLAYLISRSVYTEDV